MDRLQLQHLGVVAADRCPRTGSGLASTSGRGSEDHGSGAQQRQTWRFRLLPRADVPILGGDLAYPNPSTETYEQRFFAPFEAALPPPPVSMQQRGTPQ